MSKINRLNQQRQGARCQYRAENPEPDTATHRLLRAWPDIWSSKRPKIPVMCHRKMHRRMRKLFTSQPQEITIVRVRGIDRNGKAINEDARLDGLNPVTTKRRFY